MILVIGLIIKLPVTRLLLLIKTRLFMFSLPLFRGRGLWQIRIVLKLRKGDRTLFLFLFGAPFGFIVFFSRLA